MLTSKDAFFMISDKSGAERLKRESGENPGPILGCDRGRKPHVPLGIKIPGKAR